MACIYTVHRNIQNYNLSSCVLFTSRCSKNLFYQLYFIHCSQDFPWRPKPVDELTEASCIALHEAAALIYFTGTFLS